MSGTSPATSYFTTDDGVSLYYEAWGPGRPEDLRSRANTLIFPNGICLMEDFQRLAFGRSVVAYDLRNRGQSDTVADAAKLERGILNDVDDLDALRRHLGAERIDLLGHSYVGVMVILYAMKYPRHVNRVIQIGPAPPHADAKYPPHLKWDDGLLTEAFGKIAEFRNNMTSTDPIEICRKFWDLIRVIYVFDPKNVGRTNWMRCELPNERNFMTYWNQEIVPSMQRLRFTDEDFAKITAPVLTVHGDKDRSAAYGGGREWALRLPNGRLMTVANAAHGPWIEAPEEVFGAIETFLRGSWPECAGTVTVLDPGTQPS